MGTQRVGEAMVTAGAVGLLALGAAAMLWPLVLFALSGRPVFLAWDVPEQYWPDLAYLCSSLHDGALPWWNPYDRAGYPWYADPQSGVWHPLNWALCAVAGPEPGLVWAEVRVALGLWLGGVFGLLWLRGRGASLGASLIGATLIQAAPFCRHNLELNLVAGLAWLPLMLWAVDRLVRHSRAVDGALLGLAVAGCAWVGSPPALWYATTLAVAYLAWRLVEEWRPGGDLRGGVALGTAVGVGVALCGVVVGPAHTLAQHSIQPGFDYPLIARGALEPLQLGAVAWPLAGTHLYLGWIALVLIGVSLSPRGRHEPTRWFFVAAIAVSLVLALGDHGPLFRLVYEWVPGVSLFRVPLRYEAWLGPAAGALAAMGFDRLPDHPRPRLGVGLVVVGVVLGAVGIGWALGPGTLVAGLGVVLLAGRRLVAGAALAVLLFVDLLSTLPAREHVVFGTRPGAEALPTQVADAGLAWRYVDEFGLGFRSGTRLRHRELRGYSDPLRLGTFEAVLGSLRTAPGLLPQLNVRTALIGPHHLHGWGASFLPPPGELAAAGAEVVGPGLLVFADALPLAYFTSEVRWVDTPEQALARIAELAPAPIAVVERNPGPPSYRRPPAGGPLPSRLRIGSVHDRSGLPVVPVSELILERDALDFQVEAAAPGVVVVNEAWYPGWRATVDGESVPVYRANGLVRAVPIEPGHHAISLRFRPLEGRLWRVALLVGWLVVLILVARRWWGRRLPVAD